MTVQEYRRPESLAEVLELLTEYGDDAKLVAGGQSLMVLLHEGLIAPRVLVGLSRVGELAGIDANGAATIRALASHTAVLTDPRIRSRWGLLTEVEEAVSTVQIRNRGTLCGNLAHAYPSADPPAGLLALDATVTIRSSRGAREVPVEDFVLGPLTTVLEPDEIVTAVSLPAPPPGARYAYLKYAMRPLDFAIVGVAVRVAADADGTAGEVRVALTGAAGRPIRAREAEALVEGRPLEELRADPALLAAAGEAASAACEPLDEVFESADYRRRVAGVYVRRALGRALERALP